MHHTVRLCLVATTTIMLTAACSSSAGSGGKNSSPATTPTTTDSVATSVTSAVASTSTGSAASTKPLKIAYAGVTDAVPLYKALGDGLQKLAGTKNDKFMRYDNKLDPTTAMSNARLMVQQKPDIVIDWDGAGNADAVGRVFSQAHVPCIAVNFPMSGCKLFNLDQAGTGGQLGAATATIVRAKGWTAQNSFVLLVGATSAGIGPVQNVGGFYSALAKAFPTMEQRAATDFTLTTTKIGTSGLLIDGVGTVDGAYAATQRALQTIASNKNLVVDVLADSMVPGVMRALQQAHRDKNVQLAATGADADALNALRSNSIWVAEGDLGLTDWPAYLLAMSSAVVAGAALPDLTSTPFRVVTKTTVDTMFDGTTSKQHLPIPAADDYLKQYGLSQ